MLVAATRSGAIAPPGEAPRGPELWHRPGARKAGNSLKGKGYLAPEADGVRGNSALFTPMKRDQKRQ